MPRRLRFPVVSVSVSAVAVAVAVAVKLGPGLAFVPPSPFLK
ncbi:hypothetical protein ABH935_005064 [Catenulispora sp. GAS73]